MLNKINRFYKNGVLLEKFFTNIQSKLVNCSINSYRFRTRSLHKNACKIVSDWFESEFNFENIQSSIIGDFSFYNDIVDQETKKRTICSADKYLDHNFNLLGSGNTKLEPINWHQDFKSGYIWKPGIFYKDYNQVNSPGSADVKVPRELSRCHHFLMLGQAYIITKEEKYTLEYISQISNWIDENPLMRSINWGCVMDVAIRAANWINAFVMFKDSPEMTDNFQKKFFTSLYEHGVFIYANPKLSKLNNHNHYLSELCGLIYVALVFREINNTKKWFLKGISEFFREIRTQILPTGSTYERSVNYHRLVLEIVSSTVILLNRNNIEIPTDIWLRVEKMYEFVLYYLKPDGSAPIIGDQDDGRFLPFGLNKNIDHRYLLSIGAILFNRRDFKKYSNGYNIDCLFPLGSKSIEKFSRISNYSNALKSKAFKDAGFYVLRDKENYMFINISGKSRYNEIPSGTHTHSDLLSFVLSVEGKNILIDPGTYLYSADPKSRKHFRSTKMHNTLTVDNKNQNIINEKVLWDFQRNAIPKLLNWESTDEFDLFEAEHSGYKRLKEPVIHRRKIHFDKQNIKWTIFDHVDGIGNHEFDLYFHLDEGVDFQIIDDNSVRLADLSNIIFHFRADFNFEIMKEKAYISKAYGSKVEGNVIRIHFNQAVPAELITIIKKDKL